ncbi:uncharacterized protein [Haliotis cracherodii]|uniref:uncharacterized protein n=1 Tax=Haliotis cracherodii TaxID=6455 RepID=UPI0039EBA6AF
MAKYQKYIDASRKGIKFMAENLDENGQFTGEDVRYDIDSMYKLPNQLLLDGRPREANRLLNNLKKNFLQQNGDFLSFPEKTGWERKTSDWHVTYNWPYVNAWICMAAQKAGRFDISFPSFNYLKTFWNPNLGAFNWCEPYDAAKEGRGVDQSSCIFLNSHLGFTCLYFGDLDKARSTGDAIIKAFDGQPNLDEGLYMKISGDKGEVVTEGWGEDPKKTLFFVVKRKVGGQMYWQLGYPIIFLYKLHLATGEPRYLEYSKKVADFAHSCHSDVLTYDKSHKVMYGAGLLAAATKEEKYKKMAETIADSILGHQGKDGRWLPECPILDIFDQTSENAGWYREMFVEFDAFEQD